MSVINVTWFEKQNWNISIRSEINRNPSAIPIYMLLPLCVQLMQVVFVLLWLNILCRRIVFDILSRVKLELLPCETQLKAELIEQFPLNQN